MHGLLLVDKPAGPTSHEVVARLRRALGVDKAGHAGTLDPAATGLLVVCLGDAVKLQQWLADGDKAYQAVVAFGAATTTEDADGEVTARADPSGLTPAGLEAALPGLTGQIEQVPPMFSAVRVGGQRLHVAARAGQTVERAARRVVVHALELLELAPTGADGLRSARLQVRCGKGTYVRTLAASLGAAVGCPAHLRALRRTHASGHSLDRAVRLEEVEGLARGGAAGRTALEARLVPLAEALPFPVVEVDEARARALAQGKFLPVPGPEGPRCVVGPGRALVAVAELRDGLLRPLRVLQGPAGGRGGGSPPPRGPGGSAAG
jgi:tRNA pseudouridine55 synthase